MDHRCVGWLGTLGLGLALGWGLSGGRRAIQAQGADRVEGSILTSGQIGLQEHPTLKVRLSQDAVYYLDYRKGRLLAAVPAFRQIGTKVSILGDFAARDLVADFKLPAGTTPRFSMAVSELGVSSPVAALFVVEGSTGQIATYWCEGRGGGATGELAPKLELAEIRALP